MDGEELLEIFVSFAIACNFPLPRWGLEQFVAPVYRVSVSLTELVLVTEAFERE